MYYKLFSNGTVPPVLPSPPGLVKFKPSTPFPSRRPYTGLAQKTLPALHFEAPLQFFLAAILLFFLHRELPELRYPSYPWPPLDELFTEEKPRDTEWNRDRRQKKGVGEGEPGVRRREERGGIGLQATK